MPHRLNRHTSGRLTLTLGTRLGVCEVNSQIGEGGPPSLAKLSERTGDGEFDDYATAFVGTSLGF